MQEIFAAYPYRALEGHLIWTPMLAEDSREAAQKRQIVFGDERIHHYWDADKVLGRQLSITLPLNTPIAWDVYLIYPPGTRWDEGRPPAPVFWMHQLDEDPEFRLDAHVLKRTIFEHSDDETKEI